MFTERSSWITFESKYESVNVYDSFNFTGGAAHIDICGLGFFELYINGKQVSNDKFVPVWSHYCNRDGSTLLYPNKDLMSERTYYLRYDLEGKLLHGENQILIVVGNGWYRQTKRNIEGKNHYGDSLLLRYEITANGEVLCASKNECEYSGNFIRETNIYFGEIHDYIYNCDKRKKAQVTQFSTNLCLQDCPSDKTIRTIAFEKISQYENVAKYKASENISGYVVLRSLGGDVEIRHAEALQENGEFEYRHTGESTQIQRDIYKNTSEGMLLYPRFTWHGFQYFEVMGNAVVERVEVVHSDIDRLGKFSCNNQTLTWIYNAFLNSYLANCHCGVPSDCPHRERLGYLGDGHLTCESAMLLTDAKDFYKKWIRDILDCQDKKSGHVQHTAPFYGGGGGPGGWGGAIVIVPYLHYRYYGDIELLKECYPYQRKWIESMKGFSINSLIVKEYDGGWCLGDWYPPEKVLIPSALVNTYYFIKTLEYLIEISDILGEKADDLKILRKNSRCAFQREFYNEKTHSYADGIQGADAFALDLGLGDEKTKENFLTHYANKKLDTGIFGTYLVAKTLASLGEYQLLFDILMQEEYPSFGYWRKLGCTTLCETWGARLSRNHPMFGSIVHFIIEILVGINVKGEKLKIAPKKIKGIDEFDCELQTRFGKVCVAYKNGKYIIQSECDYDLETC